MLQSQAMDILKTGANVFLTGAPGAGKSYVLREYVAFLSSRNVDAAITAYTGIAASHINGRTLHSWAGLSFAVLTPEQEGERVRANEHLSARIRKARVLIIDEVSMLRPEEFMRVDFICKTARNSTLPFGGLQLICCGDFFQIPPVGMSRVEEDMIEVEPEPVVQISSPEKPWGTPDPNIINAFLSNPTAVSRGDEHEKKVAPVRHKNAEENKFVIDCPTWSTANMRVCYLHEQHRQGDAALLTILDEIREGNVSPASRALLVSRIGAKVAAPVGIARLYTHNENVDEINAKELLKLKTPPVVYDITSTGPTNLTLKLQKDYRVDKLVLKEGARVMFTRNNPGEGYVNGTLGEVVGFVNSQGAGETIGMITLVSTEPDPVVLTFDGRRIVVSREEWQFEEDGKVRATIRQVPLRLAWAITVHKSQGMTLDAAEIDLSRAFERGMGYVALSRVKSLANISLLGFNQTALEVSERIKKIDAEFWTQSEETEQYLASLGTEGLARVQEEFLESAKADPDDNTAGAARKNGTGQRGRFASDLHYEIDEIPTIDFTPDDADF